MVTKSKFLGHDIEFINGEWMFSDTKESIQKTLNNRVCKNCGKLKTKEGYDACLGKLPFLKNACCGHGNKNDAYIQFMNGFTIHGSEAIKLIEILKIIRDIND